MFAFIVGLAVSQSYGMCTIVLWLSFCTTMRILSVASNPVQHNCENDILIDQNCSVRELVSALVKLIELGHEPKPFQQNLP